MARLGGVSTLFVGNLDGESALAVLRGGRPVTLPLPARRAVSAFATLLRAFAGEGDRIWTPLPVDPARMADVAGLPRPALVSGPLPPAGRPDRRVPWLEIGELSARVNHRAFGLRVARSLGVALPGAEFLHSLHSLDLHLAGGGADAAPGRKWVLKLPLSAAGRGRVFGAGPVPDEAAESRAGNLLLDQDGFLFEPWMERVRDYGTSGWVTEDGPVDLRSHVLEVNPAGRFRGILLADPEADGPELLRVAAAAGRALAGEGYRGPFGVDAFRYRDATGGERLHPLAEINARLTFGHVARRLGERLGALALRMSRPDAPVAAGEFEVPLLLPGPDDPTSTRVLLRRTGA